MFRIIAPLLLLLFNVSAHSQNTIRVGGDFSCATSNIQNAVNNAQSGGVVTLIYLANNANYAGQNIDIDGKNIRLIGGYSDCIDLSPDGPRTQLNGAGGAARSVINIRGSTSFLELTNLYITGGDELLDTSSYGGAVDIIGGPHPQIIFDNVQMTGNRAGMGGGLSIRGSSSNRSAIHVASFNSLFVNFNTAEYFGGGIYCRDAKLTLLERVAIQGNITGRDGLLDRHGGGMFINNCDVEVGSTLGIFGNTANGSGGGMYVTGAETYIDLYNINANTPMFISDNTAMRHGGAINIENGAKVSAYDARILNNTARQGGGAIALYDGSSDFRSSSFLAKRSAPSELYAAINCATGIECNLIKGNLAETISGAPEEGSAIRTSADSSYAGAHVSLQGTRVSQNRGGALFYALTTGGLASALVDVSGGLIDNNIVADDLFQHQWSGGYYYLGTSLDNSTIANNVISGNRIYGGLVQCKNLNFLGATSIRSSIIWQPNKLLLAPVTALSVNCVSHVLANDFTNVPAANLSTTLISDPRFVDPTTGNFRLRLDSPALDFAPLSGSATRDGSDRNIDLPAITNRFGPADLGAYERPADLIPIPIEIIR